MPNNWINFAELRRQLSFLPVLESYDVILTQKPGSDQMVGACPLPGHTESSGDKKTNSKPFSANAAKGVWQCFGCNQSGNVIDFAVLMEGRDKRNGQDVRQVALSLHERFVQQRPGTSPAKQTVAEEPKAPREGQKTLINPPLDFALKTLDPAHPFFASRKLAPETVERFGLGFCSRGLLAGRIAVPLMDDASRLVGYGGVALDEGDRANRKGGPRFVLPANRDVEGVAHVFDRGRFLYNGFRIAKSAKLLFVAQDCETVWAASQSGIANVVGLMGDDCTDDQSELIGLMTANSARVWLITGEGAAAEAAARSLLLKVAPSRLCRWSRIAGEISPEHPALAALPRK